MDLYRELVVSANEGDLDGVLALLARKADPNHQAAPLTSRCYGTPLTEASAGFSDGHAPVISALLEAKADVEFGDSCGRTPLYWASHFGIPANVEILLRYGADPNGWLYGTPYSYPLIVASSRVGRSPRRAEAIQLLIDHKANVNVYDQRAGVSALHGVIRTQQIDCAEILLQAKADVNVRNHAGLTPLHHCRKYGWELLLRYKADPNLIDEAGRTPLHAASSIGTVRGARALLQAKAGIDRLTAYGKSALQLAAECLNPFSVEALLEAGAAVRMNKAMVSRYRHDIREMLRAAGTPEERRAKACWRSWARAMLHGPTGGDSPTEELRAFFVAYPGLRRFVGTKLLRFSRAE